MSPCSSLCTASSAFMLTQLQAFSPCCGVHVIVLNWVWQYKNGNPSSPKQADFSRCFHWQHWSWLHGHSFFFLLLWSQACERGCIHLWLHGLIFENIAVHLHFISEFFWHILHYSIRYCYKDDPQFCWLCGWWHLWNIKCIWLSFFWIFFMTMKKRALQSRNCINFGQACTPPFTFALTFSANNHCQRKVVCPICSQANCKDV